MRFVAVGGVALALVAVVMHWSGVLVPSLVAALVGMALERRA